MKKKIIKWCIAIALLAAVVLFGILPIVQWESENETEDSEYIAIRQEFSIKGANNSEEEENRLGVDFDALLAANKDTIGWLQMDGTPIDYPVVSAGKSEKYLNTSFYGKRNASGAIFTFGTVDFETPQQNITLYGHNMGKGRDVMFSTLLKYKDRAYYRLHSKVYFDTLYGGGEYRIFAAFNITTDDSFDYTQGSFDTEGEFAYFLQTAKDKTPFETNVYPTADDTIITLSTCDRTFSRATGRFVVMAVKLK